MIDLLKTHHPLIIPEGAAERVIIEKLLDEDLLIFSRSDILDISRKRNALQIQSEFLDFDYGSDYEIAILRILDSMKENFRLGKLYRDRFPVINVYTRPEIEYLVILNENREDGYEKKSKAKVKASEYCKTVLGLHNIKHEDFLNKYWDCESLVSAIKKYKKMRQRKKDEYCLADLLKDS